MKDDFTFFIPASQAHIADIYQSYKTNGWSDFIDKRLSYITDISKNLFTGIDNSGKVYFHQSDPVEIFKHYVDNQPNFNNLGVDLSLLENPIFDIKLPIPPNSGYTMNILNGNKSYITPKDIFLNLLKFNDLMLNTKAYTEVRDDFQRQVGINHGKLSNKLYRPGEAFQYIEEKLIENGQGTFEEFTQKALASFNNDKIPSFVDEIARKYLMLDMAGFHQDKYDKNDNSNMVNTIIDSLHAGQAANCDIFLVEDKKLIAKASEIFSHLRIPTKIFKPNEFLEYYKNVTEITTLTQFSSLLEDVSKNRKYLIFEDENESYHSLDFYLFNFFDGIKTDSEIPEMYLMFKYIYSKRTGCTEIEFANLIDTISKTFGEVSYIMNAENQIEERGKISYGWIKDRFYLKLFRIKDFINLQIITGVEKA